MSKFYHPLMFNNFTKSDLIKVSKSARTQVKQKVKEFEKLN